MEKIPNINKRRAFNKAVWPGQKSKKSNIGPTLISDYRVSCRTHQHHLVDFPGNQSATSTRQVTFFVFGKKVTSWNSTIVLINQDVVNASKAQTETSLKQQEVQSSALSVIIGIDKHLLCTWLSDSIFQTLHQTHQATAMIDLKLEFRLLLHNQSRYNQIKVNSIHLKCWYDLILF